MAENKKEHSVLNDILTQTKEDIIKPKIKDITNSSISEFVYMIADSFTNACAKMIYGKDAVVTKSRGSNQIPYHNMSRIQAQQTVQQNIGVRSSTNLQYVVVDSEVKARQIQSDLVNAIQQYGKVRVADLYEKSEKVKPIFSDYNYGWTNPADVHYMRNSDGYWFNMPEPVKIN